MACSSRMSLRRALLLALAHVSLATTQLAPSSLFRMIIKHADNATVAGSSIDAIDASISMALLESSSNEKIQDIAVVVEAISDANSVEESGVAVDIRTTSLNFACIAKFRDSDIDTESFDAFILETFSNSSSIERFKELLKEIDPEAFGTVSDVVVSSASLSQVSSSRSGLSAVEIIMVAVSGSIFVGVLCLICFCQKDDSQRVGPASPTRDRSVTDSEKDIASTPTIIKSPPRNMRSTDLFRNISPRPFGTIIEEAGSFPGSLAGSSVGSFSEAFSSNWFRDNDDKPTDSSVDDSVGDVFHVDVERARKEEDQAERRERARQEEEDERNDQILGASTMLVEWARYIQVIRSDPQKTTDCKLELEMVSTQSTDVAVESSFDDLSSLEETSASDSETETSKPHGFDEVEV